ncbi:TRAP transporter large permease subunit [Arenibacter sp. 6A1]|uniref:SLC13 family permease n=1 Tax=Arenibacter sp. 6A1 TaxID=2720391 RepID=UPI0014477982|nr:SLC13 family permease [Arenibacter sp. 6A1]NKI24950.1 TRAP transporter large permease subunit [Arenibacter sp. 6A1]
MTVEIALIFLIIATIVVLFALEIFTMDKIAFCTIGFLVFFGLITPEEAISGFSNTAVITILCLMIIAVALEQNGVISWMANGLKKFRNWPVLFIVPAFMFITGTISAFISSTAVVIVFIKIVTELSDKYDISKSKLLLPISFASILGGSCTLMGTSTNLIVNAIYKERLGKEFMFFEFSWYGAIFLLVSIVLVSFLAQLLPKDSKDKLREQYDVDNYITTLELAPNSSLIGKLLKDTFLGDSDISVLKFYRSGLDSPINMNRIKLQKGDRLMLSCTLDHLLRLKSDTEVIISPGEDGPGLYGQYEFKDKELADKSIKDREIQTVLVEMMMLPGARFLGKSLNELKNVMMHDAVPLAIKKRKNLRYSKDRMYTTDTLDLTRLKVGDRVLLDIDRDKIKGFDLSDNVAILQQYEAPEISKSPKRNLTLLILMGVILLAATGVLSILTSTLLGAVALLLLNHVTLESVYKKINWQILFLLAGMIPLGIAMHNTGADNWLSEKLLILMQGRPSIFSIGALFLVTMFLSAVISNNATAIIMTPIAISVATGMDLDVKPFILAVMFASNFSFFTPVGYQTNSLIYSMGIYKFKHFAMIGGIISVVLLILGTLLLNAML